MAMDKIVQNIISFSPKVRTEKTKDDSHISPLNSRVSELFNSNGQLDNNLYSDEEIKFIYMGMVIIAFLECW